ncbi:helix-turn-helix transcriptional regulator [Sphaerisporangium sp. TRM90804]|uniref:helix-turn-helix domain-containing protein n=1 Tax=Sphaerisporangium sp. TRM90804 TaxID=3031113 RepID=UPI00244C25F4|nr:helix-turn-helix transcriptional regulator [Sphaerisporangium sp. TRM90804]MDH2427594.1 helix-turn-helix transcriptional regulator [Sphaerisporangium sp. TRM90804]
MTNPGEAHQFAARLRVLKDRAGVSFGVLANRTGISRSSLHRYCAGSKIPSSYGPAHAFAKACGASNEELRELHRLWALADASRGSSPTPTAPEHQDAAVRHDAAQSASTQDAAVRHDATQGAGAGPGDTGAREAGMVDVEWRSTVSVGAPAGRGARSRDRRTGLAVVAAAATLATLAVTIVITAKMGEGSRAAGPSTPPGGGPATPARSSAPTGPPVVVSTPPGARPSADVRVYNIEGACRASEKRVPACSMGLARDPYLKYDAANVVSHRVWHDDVLSADCVLFEGDHVEDETGVGTTRWLRVRLDTVPGGTAWLPAVRTHDNPSLPVCA